MTPKRKLWRELGPKIDRIMGIRIDAAKFILPVMNPRPNPKPIARIICGGEICAIIPPIPDDSKMEIKMKIPIIIRVKFQGFIFLIDFIRVLLTFLANIMARMRLTVIPMRRGMFSKGNLKMFLSEMSIIGAASRTDRGVRSAFRSKSLS